MDILGPLPKTMDGNQFEVHNYRPIFKLMSAIQTSKTAARQIATIFIHNWVMHYRILSYLLPISGPQVVEEFLKMLYFFLRSKKLTTTPQSSSTNRQINRYNCKILARPQSYVAEHHRHCNLCMSVLTYAYNMYPRNVTGLAPFPEILPQNTPSTTPFNRLTGIPKDAYANTPPVDLNRKVVHCVVAMKKNIHQGL